jgi:hypothetical protein
MAAIAHGGDVAGYVDETAIDALEHTGVSRGVIMARGARLAARADPRMLAKHDAMPLKVVWQSGARRTGNCRMA